MNDHIVVTHGGYTVFETEATLIPNDLSPNIPREQVTYEIKRPHDISVQDADENASTLSIGEELVVDEYCGKDDEIQPFIRRKTKTKTGNVHGNMYKSKPRKGRKVRQYDAKPALKRGDHIWAAANTNSYYTVHGSAALFAVKVRDDDHDSDYPNGTVIIPVISKKRFVKTSPRIAGGQKPKRV